MALAGNFIHLSLGGTHSIINYSMFVAVFSMLTLIYQIAGLHSESFVIMPILPLALDGLNTLFFFVGGIALAAYLKVDSCGSDVSDRGTIHKYEVLTGLLGVYPWQ